jgi:glycopeptide antibiotics resistance protein
VTETRSTRDLVVAAFEHGSTDGFATIATISLLTPILANMLIFVPWGFLAFLLVDVRSRPRLATYAVAIAGGAMLALALSVWQSYFPARLIAPSDVFANAAGAALGALLGQLRKDVRIRFEP